LISDPDLQTCLSDLDKVKVEPTHTADRLQYPDHKMVGKNLIVKTQDHKMKDHIM